MDDWMDMPSPRALYQFVLPRIVVPLLSAVPLFCSPATTADISSCPIAAPLSTYQTAGFVCGLGGLTFYGFEYSASVDAGTGATLTVDDVTVVPFTDTNESGFHFIGPFSVHTGAIVSYMLRFVADPPPPVISGYSSSISRGVRRSPGPQGSATLLSVQCQGQVDNQCDDYSVTSAFISGSDQRLSDVVFFTPVSVVAANLRLVLDGTKGGMVIQSVSSSVFTTPAPVAPVPEPGTLYSVASAAALLLYTAARRRQRG